MKITPKPFSKTHQCYWNEPSQETLSETYMQLLRISDTKWLTVLGCSDQQWIWPWTNITRWLPGLNNDAVCCVEHQGSECGSVGCCLGLVGSIIWNTGIVYCIRIHGITCIFGTRRRPSQCNRSSSNISGRKFSWWSCWIYNQNVIHM